MKKALIVFGFIVMLGCREKAPSDGRPSPATIFKKARAMLAAAAKKSPMAREFLAYYDDCAVPAVAEDTRGTVLMASCRPPHQPFFVAALPDEGYDEAPSIFVAHLCTPMPTLKIGSVDLPPLAKGALLVEELVRIRASCQKNADPHDRSGEANAFMTFSVVLDEETDKRWNALMNATVQRLLPTLGAGEPYFTRLDQEAETGLTDLFGPLDAPSRRIMTAQLLVAVNIARLFLLAAAGEMDGDALAERIKDYLK